MKKLGTTSLFICILLLIAGVVTSVWAAAPRQEAAQEGEPPDLMAKRATQVSIEDSMLQAELGYEAISEGFEGGVMPPPGGWLVAMS